MMFQSSPEFAGANLHPGSQVRSSKRLCIVQLCLVERLTASQHVNIDHACSNISEEVWNRYRQMIFVADPKMYGYEATLMDIRGAYLISLRL